MNWKFTWLVAAYAAHFEGGINYSASTISIKKAELDTQQYDLDWGLVSLNINGSELEIKAENAAIYLGINRQWVQLTSELQIKDDICHIVVVPDAFPSDGDFTEVFQSLHRHNLRHFSCCLYDGEGMKAIKE